MRTPNKKTLLFYALGLLCCFFLMLPALCAPGQLCEYGKMLSLLLMSAGAVGMGYSNPVPGQRTGIQTHPRDVLYSLNGVRYGRGVFDSANSFDGGNTLHTDEMRPGIPMARITASKKWVACKRTLVNMTGATVTALVVDNASAFIAGETLTIGSNVGIVCSAINYATNTITIPSTTVVDDTAVFATADVNTVSLAGAEICRGILNEFVKFKDEDGVLRDKQFGQMVIAGEVDPNICLQSITEIRADTGNKLAFIQFADDSGQV